MAKLCDSCKLFFPDDLEVCPHCAEAVEMVEAAEEHLAGLPQEEAGDITLLGDANDLVMVGEAEETNAAQSEEEEAILLEEEEQVQPSSPSPEVDSWAIGSSDEGIAAEDSGPDTEKIAPPKPAKAAPPSMLSQGREESQEEAPSKGLSPKATKLAPASGAKTMLAQDIDAATGESRPPAEAEATKIDAKATKLAPASAPKTMLARGTAKETILAGPDAGPAPISMLAQEGGIEAAEEEPAKPADPKKTMLATGASPTTKLAPDEEMHVEVQKHGEKKTMLAAGATPTTKLAPDEEMHGEVQKHGEKKTMLAGGATPVTKLAPPEEMEAEARQRADKKTKLAAGAAPVTRLAPPEEMEAEARQRADKKTKLAAGAAPVTRLAPPEEMDTELQASPLAKTTILAAGAARPTTLAKSDEQDLLSLPEPEDEDFLEEAERSALDLGSSPSIHGLSIPRLVAEEAGEHAEAEGLEKTKGAKPKKPAHLRRWVGGGLVGTLLGSAACLGLVLFDVVPLDSLKEMAGLSVNNSGRIPNPGPQNRSAVDLPTALNHLDQGDFAKAVEIFNQLGSSPDVLAKRGQARWLDYLQAKKKQNNSPLSKDDPAVTQAREDLTNAKNAEGKYWLGQMTESLEGAAAARKVYQEGLEQFKEPAEQKPFQAALDRLDSASEERRGARLPRPAAGEMLAAEGLPLPLLILMLEHQAGQAPAAQEPEEAGFDFWRAAKLAKEQKYSEAIEALQRARAGHEQRRFHRLRKAQNPTSDPNEEIFLRSCDELAAYWKFREAAKKQGFPDLDSALAVLKDKEAGKTLASMIEMLKKADPALKDPVEGLDALLKAKSATDKQMTDIKGVLEAANYDAKAPEEGVKKLAADGKIWSEALAQAAEHLQLDKPSAVPDAVKQIVEDKKKSDEKAETLNGVVAKLTEAEFLGPQPNRADILEGTDRAIREARSPLVNALTRGVGGVVRIGGAPDRLAKQFDLTGRLAASEANNVRYQALLQQSKTPRQMLDLWPTILRDRTHKALTERALRDAHSVIQDPNAGGEAQAQAHFVEGLALRNQGKYAEARKALQIALKDGGTEKKGDWRALGQDIFQELTQPEAYYVPEARAKRAMHKPEAALSLVREGLEVFPPGSQKEGALLAQRALARLDMARKQEAQGKLKPDNPLVADAMKDAEEALKAGAKAEGSFALGRLFEELGDPAEAHKSYREALAAHPQQDLVGSSYRLALARLLLQQPHLPRQAAGLPERMPVDVGEQPAVGSEVDEPLRLAEEALHAGNLNGHFVKAWALVEKKRWNDAVLEYALGLEKLSTSPNRAKELRYLIDHHPAFSIPDGANSADPLVAERHYLAGLRHYWTRRYDNAEEEFVKAVKNHDQDARFMYFLGLARLAQGKKDFAEESFKRGGMLEQQSKPSSASVSATLERVQGQQREVLNRYRP